MSNSEARNQLGLATSLTLRQSKFFKNQDMFDSIYY